MAQKIVPHLWFDSNAVEAAEFYVDLFDDAQILHTSRYPDVGQEFHGREAGSVMTVKYELAGFTFLAINAGPHFMINPSISFILNFDPSKLDDAEAELQRYWDVLTPGGGALMPLGEYPFSPKYGWVADRFGVSWQLMLTDPESEDRPFITPELMFAGQVNNRAREALDFYVSIFSGSYLGNLAEYQETTGLAGQGSLMFGDFNLAGTWFAAMDSPVEHAFGFNEAVSLLVNCDDQDEIDRYWEALSAVPEAEQCGWLKDRFGVSWQIVPAGMESMFDEKDSETVRATFDAVMQMRKFDIAKLQ